MSGKKIKNDLGERSSKVEQRLFFEGILEAVSAFGT